MKKLYKSIIKNIKYPLSKLKIWLLVKLFSDDEKYLIAIALDARIDELERNRVIYKNSDTKNINEDITDYKKLKPIFSTDSWR